MSTFLIEVSDLHKSYGSLKAVNGVDLKIKKGQCFGLLGPNGAGKSTTLEIIEGIKSPSSGTILYRGEPRGRDFKQKIGIQFQSTALQDFMSVEEGLKTFSRFYKNSVDINDLIERCQLGDFLKQDHRKISGGQKQRLLLAIALINDPELIFLDEPTTGLDPQSRVNFWELIQTIKAEGRTVVLTTHYMDEAYNLCDEIVIIDKGQIIAEGEPERLLKKHFSGKKISLPIELKPSIPQDFPWSFFEDGRRIKFHAEQLNEVLNYLATHSIDISGIEVHSQSLDDLFIHLTGKDLRG